MAEVWPCTGEKGDWTSGARTGKPKRQVIQRKSDFLVGSLASFLACFVRRLVAEKLAVARSDWRKVVHVVMAIPNAISLANHPRRFVGEAG